MPIGGIGGLGTFNASISCVSIILDGTLGNKGLDFGRVDVSARDYSANGLGVGAESGTTETWATDCLMISFAAELLISRLPRRSNVVKCRRSTIACGGERYVILRRADPMPWLDASICLSSFRLFRLCSCVNKCSAQTMPKGDGS